MYMLLSLKEEKIQAMTRDQNTSQNLNGVLSCKNVYDVLSLNKNYFRCFIGWLKMFHLLVKKVFHLDAELGKS